jgi:quercetin dioxygenase-like cupin family protein
MYRYTLLPIALLVPLVLAPPGVAGQALPPDPGPEHHIVHTPSDARWSPGPASFEAGARFEVLEGDPGRPGLFTMRIHLPDGFAIAPHTHTGVERVTVLSGTFRLGMGEMASRAATRPLPPGAYFSLPPGMPHFAFAEGETTIQLSSLGPWEIEYVDPADDPRGR